MQGRARKRAAGVLAEVAERFQGVGYQAKATAQPLGMRLGAEGRPALHLALRPTGGRVFGGTFALEVSTAEPVFPATAGVVARGRGVVRLETIQFRGRGRDPEAARLAERLGKDRSLIRALSQVHFEQIRVEPDGRPIIRHMGGSLVWLLFPPMARPIPLVPEQVSAITAAMEQFTHAGGAGDPP